MSKILLTTAALVALYHPGNAQNLSQEEKDNIQTLTSDEVDALAKAYPNTPQDNNYLLLLDKRLPADKQIYQLSSWENLAYLWKLGQTHFVPYAFRGQESTQKVAQPTSVPATDKAVVDLSEGDAANAEGLKKDALQVDAHSGEASTSETIGDSKLANGLNADLRTSQPSTDPTLTGEILAPVGSTEQTNQQTTVVDASANSTNTNTSGDQKSEDLKTLEAELEQLKKDGAHHMTIKAKEKQIAELKGEA